MATGLLVVGVGAATRLLRFLSDGEKTYLGVIRFTGSTDTDDATGSFEQTGRRDFSRAELETVLPRFLGEIEQIPPRVSALKVAGKRAYALYRDHGVTPPLRPRKVVIHQIEVLDLNDQDLRLRVRCGGGTYIRALARDLGEALGCPAHLAALRREKVGPLDLSRAMAPDAFEEGYRKEGDAVLLPPLTAVEGWPRLPLTPEQVEMVRQGVQPQRQWWELPPLPAAGKVALVDDAGALVAVAEFGAPGPRLLMVLGEVDAGH